MNHQVRSSLLFFLFLSTMLFAATPAFAHFAWLGLSDYTPKKGAKLKGTVGWGHSFPLEGFLSRNRLENFSILGQEKEEKEVLFSSPLEWESEEGLTTEGGYVVTAERKPGFYTKTTKGGRSASKQDLEGVISCSYSHMSMKAVASQGAVGEVSQVVGLPIEIVPLDNPASLKQGDYLHVRILLHGEPYRGEVYGTYAGFSTDSNTYAYVTTTDTQGYGRIRLLQPGLWLLKTSHETPYPDSEECDVEKFITSLTFAVQ